MPSLTLWNENNTLWLLFSLYFVAGMRHRIQVKRSVPLPSLERVCLLLVTALVFFPRTHLSYIRHPLYAGLLIALTGTTLVSGDFGSLLGLFLAVNIFRLKAYREEQILEAEFGAGYTVYRAHTGGILPRIAHI